MRRFFVLAFVGLLLAGCQRQPQTLNVFAASSLTEVMTALANEFARSHPSVQVKPVFGGSQVLRMQIEQGAPAGVFASANPQHMQALVDAGLVRDAVPFAANKLTVVVSATDPGAITRFQDLPAARTIVIADTQVPAGVYTEAMLQRAQQNFGEPFVQGIRNRVVSREGNVRLVRAKVALGQADAAIVYETDARSAKDVRAIPIPDDINPRATYTMGVVVDSPATKQAQEFVAFVSSDAASTILKDHGFAASTD